MISEEKNNIVPLRIACKKMSLDEKLSLIGDIDIEYPRMLKVVDEIKRCRKMSKLQNKSENMLLYGMSGVGKTYICKKIEAENPPIIPVIGDSIIPVLYIRVEPFATVKSVTFKLLKILGDPFPDKGSEYVQTGRFTDLSKACKVELIIFDEIHHFLEKKRKDKEIKDYIPIRNLTNFIKVKSDETKIPFVLVGTKDAIAILENDKDKQLLRRFKRQLHFKPFKYGTEEEIKEFLYLLNHIDEKLPFPSNSCFLSENILKNIFYVTEGIIDYVFSLISYAAEIALKEKAHCITLAHLALSYDEVLKAITKKENPFLKANHNVYLQQKNEKK